MKIALLESSGIDNIKRKICGLYVLERNIIVLSRSGFDRVILKLSEEELDFYERKIKKHIKISGFEVEADLKATVKSGYYLLPADIFIQQHYFNDTDKYFDKKSGRFIPKTTDEIFKLENADSIKKGIDLISKYIIENTGGFIAQKVNKRVSIPISKVLSKTRIHPNYLTIVNMVIGLMSSFMVFLCTYDSYSVTEKYLLMIMGGFLFQAASVLDGVDGEVAKFTLKVSKLGGWLDTLSDNSTLLLFLISSSYLYYTVFGGIVSLITIGVLFAGLAVMLGIMVSYLSKYSNSGSLVAYDREFLQKLPESDRLVQFALKMKYITKKEMFSICFFAIGLTGYIYMVIPMASFVLLAAALILTRIHFRYIGEFAKELAKSRN